MESRSAPKFRRRAQALHYLAILQVRFDDFVDVGRIHIAVAHALRVHHGHRACGAAVQATGLVHAHLAGPGQASGLDQRLAALKGLLGAMLGAAGLAIGAFVEAEEDVALAIAGRGRGVVAHALYSRKHRRAARRATAHRPAWHRARASPATGPDRRTG